MTPEQIERLRRWDANPNAGLCADDIRALLAEWEEEHAGRVQASKDWLDAKRLAEERGREIERLRESVQTERNRADMAEFDMHQAEGREAKLRRRAEWAEAEVERLSELLWGSRCVFCGEIVGKERKNQDIADEILREHVRRCPKHPLAQAEARLAKVVEAAGEPCPILGTASPEFVWERAMSFVLAAAQPKEEK